MRVSTSAGPGRRGAKAPPDRRYAARMLASLLALAAAPGYGASDFLAGLKARTVPTVVVAAVSQGAGLLFAAAIVAVRGRPPPGHGVRRVRGPHGIRRGRRADEPLPSARDRTAALARLALRERLPVVQLIGAGLSLVGVLLITLA